MKKWNWRISNEDSQVDGHTVRATLTVLSFTEEQVFIKYWAHIYLSVDLIIQEIQYVIDKIQFTLTLVHFHFRTVYHQLSHRQNKVSVWLLRMASERAENTLSQLSSMRSQSRRQQRRPLRLQRPQQQRRLQNSGSTSHSPPSDLPWVELKNQIYLDLEVEE